MATHHEEANAENVIATVIWDAKGIISTYLIDYLRNSKAIPGNQSTEHPTYASNQIKKIYKLDQEVFTLPSYVYQIVR